MSATITNRSPSQTPRGRGNRHNQTNANRTNVRKAPRPALSSPSWSSPSQIVDSLAQWLEHWIFNREDRVWFPRKAGIFFSYALFLCYDFHVVRWGLVRDRTLISRKWLRVIINDDFLEKGECYGLALPPSIICLGRLRIASKYIFNLWQLRQGVDSLAQWLEHWIFNREDRFRFPRKAGIFFSYASFLCYGYHVVRPGYNRFFYNG